MCSTIKSSHKKGKIKINNSFEKKKQNEYGSSFKFMKNIARNRSLCAKDLDFYQNIWSWKRELSYFHLVKRKKEYKSFTKRSKAKRLILQYLRNVCTTSLRSALVTIILLLCYWSITVKSSSLLLQTSKNVQNKLLFDAYLTCHEDYKSLV